MALSPTYIYPVYFTACVDYSLQVFEFKYYKVCVAQSLANNYYLVQAYKQISNRQRQMNVGNTFVTQIDYGTFSINRSLT